MQHMMCSKPQRRADLVPRFIGSSRQNPQPCGCDNARKHSASGSTTLRPQTQRRIDSGKLLIPSERGSVAWACELWLRQSISSYCCCSYRQAQIPCSVSCPFLNAFQVTAENSMSPEWSLIIDLGSTDII